MTIKDEHLSNPSIMLAMQIHFIITYAKSFQHTNDDNLVNNKTPLNYTIFLQTVNYLKNINIKIYRYIAKCQYNALRSYRNGS